MSETISTQMKGEFPPLRGNFTAYHSIIAGPSLAKLHSLIIDFASLDHNILFAGERGTGKEMFADFYIQASQRKDNFEKINCAGVEDDHLRSELFGHTKGAFTGATGEKNGLFTKVNNGGGIFLDELGDATKKFQAAILRVLQNGDYFPLGSIKHKKLSDVKIIAATSKVDELREDLCDRFKILYIPPLAKRKNDIPQIIRQVWHNIKAKNNLRSPQYISQNALDGLMLHDWPGNVRELCNALELAALLSLRESSDTLRSDAFPTVPNLINFPQPSNSRKRKIQNLTVNSQPIPMKEFLIPPQVAEANKSQKTAQTDLPILTKTIFQSIAPKQYSNAFYEYCIQNGIKAPYLTKKFNGDIPASTARQKLREAEERIKL